MAGGNTPINRIAGAGQSRVIKAGETFTGPIASFVPREDTVIESLRETVVYDNQSEEVSVLGSDITFVSDSSVLVEDGGQNISGETLHQGEIYVPRYGCFTTIRPTSGSVVAYLLLSPKQIDRKINDNV